MARYQRKLPPPDIDAARSWIRKPIRDAMENKIGFVVDVAGEEHGIRLVARFPGESEDRLIALAKTDDGNYLMPGEVKARYRPATADDLKRLRALAASSS